MRLSVLSFNPKAWEMTEVFCPSSYRFKISIFLARVSGLRCAFVAGGPLLIPGEEEGRFGGILKLDKDKQTGLAVTDRTRGL